MGSVNELNLTRVFTYQKPNADTQVKYEEVSSAAMMFATIILRNCPDSADRTTALRTLRECRMWANASIALDGEI